MKNQQTFFAYLITLLVILPAITVTAQVNSGSDGNDGAFNPITDTTIDMHDHPNGIYQYTSVNIPVGVYVSFIPNANNTPVTWLVQNGVTINGTVNLSAHSGNGPVGGVGGPGGWAGGSSGSNPTSGQGPGGGGIGADHYGGGGSFGTQATTPTCSCQVGTAGSIYGNQFLLPLLGGSGGGSGPADEGGGGGGGGGGAILIASSSKIELNGSIIALGSYDSGSTTRGGGGSGGGVRLVAPSFVGIGGIDVHGGYGNGASSAGGSGRIRIDAFQSTFGGSFNGLVSQGFQPIIIPAPGQGVQLNIASIGGIAVSQNPSGAVLTPDAIISGQQANPITIVVNCANLPLNTPVTVTVKPANGLSVSAIGNNTSGTLASSIATVSLNVPRGGGIVYATTVVAN